MLEQRIGLIGAGQMATALAQGFLASKLTTADRLIASDPDERARNRFAETTSIAVTADNREVIARSDVIILAVKPQHLAPMAAELRDALLAKNGKKLFVSIAAGVRLASLAEWLGSTERIVRVMPNTPCLVGQGASAYSLGQHATAADGALVEQLLRSVGSVWQVEEKLLDAVTGLAGSGPAFIYVVIEALSDAGVRMGLPRPMAAEMAARTVRGAAEMVLATGEHTAILKDRVASPGGTTIAGLHELESGGLRSALMAAVEAATRRSVELGVMKRD